MRALQHSNPEDLLEFFKGFYSRQLLLKFPFDNEVIAALYKLKEKHSTLEEVNRTLEDALHRFKGQQFHLALTHDYLSEACVNHADSHVIQSLRKTGNSAFGMDFEEMNDYYEDYRLSNWNL